MLLASSLLQSVFRFCIAELSLVSSFIFETSPNLLEANFFFTAYNELICASCKTENRSLAQALTCDSFKDECFWSSSPQGCLAFVIFKERYKDEAASNELSDFNMRYCTRANSLMYLAKLS